MRSPTDFRTGKPGFYPDQTIYAEFACAELGLEFRDLDGGSGLIFSVASRDGLLHFGAGRCSWYPQNNATASTLASDKYFTSRILREAGVPALGGEYFFLHERYRAHRPAGVLAVAEQAEMRVGKRPHQPGPDRPLVIRGVTLGR